jgi:hypothetical protein
MSQERLRRFLQSRVDVLIAVLVFAATFSIFFASPVTQVTDSNYSMLLSQSLLEHRSFTLDDYAIPHLKVIPFGSYNQNGNIYQIEVVGKHFYYYFPPGTSILSVPYVALMNLFGISAANADGTYNPQGETRIEATLAALLMALLASVFYLASRFMLPRAWSLLIALGGTLGTQIWSTASRAMWTHTWDVLLLGLVLMVLLAQETKRRDLNPVLLASLLSWMYFVRPTSSIFIIALSIYILFYYRRIFLSYVLTGAAWFALFAGYSWFHFGQLQPNYYHAGRLSFAQVWIAFPGNLISPSRGLFVYVPVLIFIAYLLVKFRREVTVPRLVWLALSVIVAHMVVIAGFVPWTGGHSFGARYSTDLVPWFVLLSILGVKALLGWREKQETKINALNWHLPLAVGGLLLSLSIFVNGTGAISPATMDWNALPINIDREPGRLWDWKQPQFLAHWQDLKPPVQTPAEKFNPAQTGRTSADAPMPDSGFKATLSAFNVPAELKVGQQVMVQVKVRNISDSIWPAMGQEDSRYQVKLGNHWLDADNVMVVLNDGRALLPRDLEPGGEVELPLAITAPNLPGEYTLELDMVQEYIAWFEEGGSKTLRIKVSVK